MPLDLTPVDVFSNPSAPLGSDVPNASNMQAVLQTHANRSEYNYQRGLEAAATLTNLQQACSLRFNSGTADPATMLVLSGGEHVGIGAYSLGAGDTEITVPASGVYMVMFGAELTSDSATDNIEIELSLQVGGSVVCTATGRRFSTTTSHSVTVARTCIVEVNVAQVLNFLLNATAGTPSIVSHAQANLVNVLRVG
jgi:hypothetical protein